LEKIVVCKLLTVKLGLCGASLRPFTYVADNDVGYLLEVKINKVVEFLLTENKLSVPLFSAEGEPNLDFNYWIPGFTFYLGGCYGRPLVPNEAWIFEALKPRQQHALSRLLKAKRLA